MSATGSKEPIFMDIIKVVCPNCGEKYGLEFGDSSRPIPVSERLPQIGRRWYSEAECYNTISEVVLAYDDRNWYIAWFQEPDHWESPDLPGRKLSVTHWQRLPPKPG